MVTIHLKLRAPYFYPTLSSYDIKRIPEPELSRIACCNSEFIMSLPHDLPQKTKTAIEENTSTARKLFDFNFDAFVKSPSAALRFTFVIAAYHPSTPHSSGFARLASGAFYAAIAWATFYEIINSQPLELPSDGRRD